MLVLAWEIFYMGAFVFVAAYCLHFIACKRGWTFSDNDDQDSDLDTLIEFDDTSERSGNSFLDKWMDLGGGYYGTVAFVSLVLIELAQLKQFIVEWQGAGDFINNLGIGTIISFFVEQFTNFITAVIWPVNYLGRYSIFEFAIFILITYLIYERAKKLAITPIEKS